MRKKHRGWFGVAAVTAAVVFLVVQTISTTRAQGDPARPATMIWAPVKDAGAPPSLNVYRAKVPGGWLVLVHQQKEKGQSSSQGFGMGLGIGSGVTFVPDPEHSW